MRGTEVVNVAAELVGDPLGPRMLDSVVSRRLNLGTFRPPGATLVTNAVEADSMCGAALRSPLPNCHPATSPQYCIDSTHLCSRHAGKTRRWSRRADMPAMQRK
jgi:hypothetical protein